MRDWNLQLEFKLRDAWIGAYWVHDGNCFDIWVCIVPCIPIHFSCWGNRWGMPAINPDDGKDP